MFTIGEFSRLCCISARMLRHYDAIGLLHPKTLGTENGYRYYDVSQLSVIKKIARLKEYEFSLNEIKQLILIPDEDLVEQIRLQLEKMYDQKQHYELIIHHMENFINHKEDYHMNNYQVITMTQKEQKVLSIPRTINVCSDDFHKLAQDLKHKLKSQGLRRIGPFQIRYLDKEFIPEQANVELQVEVNSDADGIITIPAGLYVTTIHNGSMKEISSAYQAIMTWLSVHPEYEISDSSIERLLKDESMVSQEQELETAVLFPIQLRK
jgi:DNA-binding transcriptional MerR regulator